MPLTLGISSLLECKAMRSATDSATVEFHPARVVIVSAWLLYTVVRTILFSTCTTAETVFSVYPFVWRGHWATCISRESMQLGSEQNQENWFNTYRFFHVPFFTSVSFDDVPHSCQLLLLLKQDSWLNGITNHVDGKHQGHSCIQWRMWSSHNSMRCINSILIVVVPIVTALFQYTFVLWLGKLLLNWTYPQQVPTGARLKAHLTITPDWIG